MPVYETIGGLVPLLLVLARMVQGFAVGGEFGGATAFMVEYAPEGKRGLYGSWQFFTQGASLVVGLLLAVGMTAAVPEEALYSWAWRVLFLIALPLGLVGLYLRLRLEDTPAFQAAEKRHGVEGTPLRETLKDHGKNLLKVVGLTWLGTSITYLFIFMPTYLSERLDVPLPLASTADVIGLASFIMTVLVSAMLSDRLGRRKPFLISTPVLVLILIVPAFVLLQTDSGGCCVRGGQLRRLGWADHRGRRSVAYLRRVCVARLSSIVWQW